MIALAKAFIGGNVLYLGIGAALVTLVIGWDSSRKAKWVESGKQEVRVEIRRETDAAISRGAAAANKSVRVQPSRGTPLTYRD
jgi:hypothetical protein